MKKIFLTVLVLAGVSLLTAADLIIAEKGISGYQIVIPEGSGNKRLDHFVTLGGKVLRTAIHKAAGVQIPLVTESKRIPGKKAIIVGNTAALRKADLSSEKFAPWEYEIKVVDGDIFIYGRDYPAPLKMELTRFLHYTLGLLKSSSTPVL